MSTVRIVELGIADAHLNVGHADVVGVAVGEGTVLSADGDGAGVADGVADEVRRKELIRVLLIRAGFAKGGESALEFASHGVEEDGMDGGGVSCSGTNFFAVLGGGTVRGKRD